MKTFEELVQEMKAENKEGTLGRFSKSTFDDMAVTLLNDVGYKPTTYKTVKGEDGEDTVEINEFSASEGVRRSIYNVLVEFGVSKQEAQTVLDGEYKFNKFGGMHEFISELLYNYAQARQFNFIPRQDFRGGIRIVDVEESTRTYAINEKFRKEGGPTESTIRYDEHKVLRVDASAPSWVKHRLN